MTRLAHQAVVIGTSAGGVDVLSQILPALPADYPLPVLAVIHLPPDRTSIIASLFARKCQMKVVEAEDKVSIEPGTIYFAPPDYHLLVERDFRLSLSSEEPVMFSRPAIDPLFETAADSWGAGVIAVILTGASADGAVGAKAVAEAGGRVLVQTPELAYASAMPEAALGACPEAEAMSPKDIAQALIKAVKL